jgi:repressor LexA
VASWNAAAKNAPVLTRRITIRLLVRFALFHHIAPKPENLLTRFKRLILGTNLPAFDSIKHERYNKNMNEKQTPAEAPVRPTKKQRELLTYIEQFIAEHGYSPSYREIMAGLNYTSVATVALHVTSLIKRGHLRKRDFSARSLELVKPTGEPTITSNQVKPAEERWLIEKVGHAFAQAETLGVPDEQVLADLTVLLHALQVLGLEGAAQSFTPRLTQLKQMTKP